MEERKNVNEEKNKTKIEREEERECEREEEGMVGNTREHLLGMW